MKRVFVVVAAGVLLAGGVARAEVSGSDSDRFMKDPPKQTVYATDQHMSFSVRTSLIHWLGGVTVVKEHDLRSAERELPPASGSLAERATVYSLVNTLLLNVEGTRAVTLLWNGVQRESFAGHLDTTRPLSADTSLVVAR